MMAKLFALLFALCVVPSIVTAKEFYLLSGIIVCDHCNVGFETSACRPIEGAVVTLECVNRTNTNKITHTQTAVTDLHGVYRMNVTTENKGDDDICNVMLKSGDPNCSDPSVGRDQARVILNSNNGIATNLRSANTMMYQVKTALPNCKQTLQMYQEAEDED